MEDEYSEICQVFLIYFVNLPLFECCWVLLNKIRKNAEKILGSIDI